MNSLKNFVYNIVGFWLDYWEVITYAMAAILCVEGSYMIIFNYVTWSKVSCTVILPISCVLHDTLAVVSFVTHL